MLPPSHLDRIEEFLQAIARLQKTAEPADNLEDASLERTFQEVQQISTSLILGGNGDDSNQALAPRIQSILTEIHRQMRLLQMDVMFLKASRQSATALTRQRIMSDRIKTLIGYCEALRQTQ